MHGTGSKHIKIHVVGVPEVMLGTEAQTQMMKAKMAIPK